MKNVRMLAVFIVLLATIAAEAFATGQPEGAEPQIRETRTITLWSAEVQPERMTVLEEIATSFEEDSGITVEIVPVEESQMGERLAAAFSAGELPDVVDHALHYTLAWAEAGILDASAATEIIGRLGEESFSSGALDLVAVDAGYAAVPVSGWTQLLVYRKDLFQEAGLAPPTDYESILAAIEALHNPPELFGFVAATDPSHAYLMEVVEHLSLANGVDVVDADGNVTLDGSAMRETLEFYKAIAEASPPGNLYWQQSRELYLSGQAAMIIWSPFIMDELAGLRDSVPVTALEDPTGDELARNTGFVTRVAGPSNPEGSGYATLVYYGITVDADTEAAQRFVEYSMNERYLDLLAMAPEGKFPVRRGTPSDGDLFVAGWSRLPIGVDRQATLSQFYPSDVIAAVVEGLDSGSRWGFSQGYGALTARIYDTRVVAETVRRYIDGEISVDEALREIQSRVEALAE